MLTETLKPIFANTLQPPQPCILPFVYILWGSSLIWTNICDFDADTAPLFYQNTLRLCPWEDIPITCLDIYAEQGILKILSSFNRWMRWWYSAVKVMKLQFVPCSFEQNISEDNKHFVWTWMKSKSDCFYHGANSILNCCRFSFVWIEIFPSNPF